MGRPREFACARSSWVIPLLIFFLLLLPEAQTVVSGEPDYGTEQHHIEVPFHYQEGPTSCGAASLEMVFDFYGEDIPQNEIINAVRTSGRVDSLQMIRAAHFSNLSSSFIEERHVNMTGYSLRKLGYAAFETGNMTLDELKSLIAMDYPINLVMWYSDRKDYTHFRVAIGYNRTHILLHDPAGSANRAMNYALFLDLWNVDGLQAAVFVSLWKVDIIMPETVYAGETFKVTANITYPCPEPFARALAEIESASLPPWLPLLPTYHAVSNNATIILPPGLTLAGDEKEKKAFSETTFLPGKSVLVNWTVEAKASGAYNITVFVEGKISGVAGTPGAYYLYQDRIGGTATRMVAVKQSLYILIGIVVFAAIAVYFLATMFRRRVRDNGTNTHSGQR